jgi:hypothetical protein
LFYQIAVPKRPAFTILSFSFPQDNTGEMFASVHPNVLIEEPDFHTGSIVVLQQVVPSMALHVIRFKLCNVHLISPSST